MTELCPWKHHFDCEKSATALIWCPIAAEGRRVEQNQSEYGTIDILDHLKPKLFEASSP